MRTWSVAAAVVVALAADGVRAAVDAAAAADAAAKPQFVGHDLMLGGMMYVCIFIIKHSQCMRACVCMIVIAIAFILQIPVIVRVCVCLVCVACAVGGGGARARCLLAHVVVSQCRLVIVALMLWTSDSYVFMNALHAQMRPTDAITYENTYKSLNDKINGGKVAAARPSL